MMTEIHSMPLDTTGVYFRTKGQPVRTPAIDRDAPWKKLFLKEAFFLYEHRDAIREDRRMLLTPLPFENNLAFSGTSGLRDATLGVYLDWWDHCERAVLKEGDRVTALTYLIAGSPLSGRNSCSIVREDGTTAPYSFPIPFSEIWKSFMEANGRYDEPRQVGQAYTLEETVARLHERFPR